MKLLLLTLIFTLFSTASYAASACSIDREWQTIAGKYAFETVSFQNKEGIFLYEEKRLINVHGDFTDAEIMQLFNQLVKKGICSPGSSALRCTVKSDGDKSVTVFRGNSKWIWGVNGVDAYQELAQLKLLKLCI